MNLSLSKKLEEWVNQHLISAQTAAAIISYEKNKSSTHKMLWGFILLGIAVIGIGIIAVVAANWNNISPFIKLSIAFFGLIMLSGSIYFLINELLP